MHNVQVYTTCNSLQPSPNFLTLTFLSPASDNIFMALNGLLCADVPLRNCSLTHRSVRITHLFVLVPASTLYSPLLYLYFSLIFPFCATDTCSDLKSVCLKNHYHPTFILSSAPLQLYAAPYAAPYRIAEANHAVLSTVFHKGFATACQQPASSQSCVLPTP